MKFYEDEDIRKYLSNNNFVKESSWNDVAMNQLFMVEVTRSINRATAKYNILQDVINFQLPAERYEYQHQNLFNELRNTLTGISRNYFRLSFIENKSYDQRIGFMMMNETKSDGENITGFNKTITSYPNQRYYDINLSLIKKDVSKDVWIVTKKFIYKDCVTDTLNDIDFSVDKADFVKCEISGRAKLVQIFTPST